MLPVLDRGIEVRAVWEGPLLVRLDLGLTSEPPGPEESRLSRALKRVLEGRSPAPPVPLRAGGTLFQQRVWAAASRIPYGEVRSYGEIAAAIDSRSPRAVGRALAANPLPLLVPCHRVIGKGGDLKGFSCGVALKELLLRMEAEVCLGEDRDLRTRGGGIPGLAKDGPPGWRRPGDRGVVP